MYFADLDIFHSRPHQWQPEHLKPWYVLLQLMPNVDCPKL